MLTRKNVANGFNQSGSGYGVVKIDMNKVTSDSYKGYDIYPRVNGVEGLSLFCLATRNISISNE